LAEQGSLRVEHELESLPALANLLLIALGFYRLDV
jgi:hypothetical protein